MLAIIKIYPVTVSQRNKTELTIAVCEKPLQWVEIIDRGNFYEISIKRSKKSSTMRKLPGGRLLLK